MSQKSLNDWFKSITPSTPVDIPLLGQDRVFVRQLKQGGKYGYIKFEDSLNKRYIIYSIRNDTIREYNSIQDLEKDGWVLD